MRKKTKRRWPVLAGVLLLVATACVIWRGGHGLTVDQRIAQHMPLIRKHALRAGLPVELVVEVVRAESGGDERAVARAGALATASRNEGRLLGEMGRSGVGRGRKQPCTAAARPATSRPRAKKSSTAQPAAGGQRPDGTGRPGFSGRRPEVPEVGQAVTPSAGSSP